MYRRASIYSISWVVLGETWCDTLKIEMFDGWVMVKKRTYQWLSWYYPGKKKEKSSIEYTFSIIYPANSVTFGSVDINL